MTANHATVGALVLAAGFSHRFGGIKLLAPLAGTTVVATTLARIGSAVEPLMVVTRPELADELAPLARQMSVFPEAHRGMGETLAHGIAQVTEWDAALVCLADMPFIPAALYRQLAAASAPDRIVVPEYQGRHGNPVSFGSEFFGELAQLRGDRGGRALFTRHPEALHILNTDEAAILDDIDTPEDLDRLAAHYQVER